MDVGISDSQSGVSKGSVSSLIDLSQNTGVVRLMEYIPNSWTLIRASFWEFHQPSIGARSAVTGVCYGSNKGRLIFDTAIASLSIVD